MPFQEIDLVALVAVIMGVSVVLVPVIGLTARFALKPTVEALSKFFDSRNSQDMVALMERRMLLLEQQMDMVESTVARVAEGHDFDRQLKSGTPPTQTTSEGSV